MLPFPALLRPLVAFMIPQPRRLAKRRAAVRNLLFPPTSRSLSKDELSVMKLLIEGGKDTDPESLTARLLLLTAAAVSTTWYGWA